MRRSALIAMTFAGLAGAGALAACASDDEPRPAADDDAGATPDGAVTEDGGADGSPTADARAPFDPRDEAVTCAATPCVTQLVAGDEHFCARLSDETVRCWGSNAAGQLGRALDADSAPKPADVTGVVELAAAGSITCARLASGSVGCWGSNVSGELGRSTSDEDPHPDPRTVPLTSVAVRIDVGPRNACAVTAGGEAICWGSNESAQLARGEPDLDPGSPELAVLGARVVRTAFGVDTGFAITGEGTLLGWGALAGPAGALAGRVSSVTPSPVAAAVENLGSVSSLSVSGTTPGRPPPGSLPGSPPPPPNQHACAVVQGDVYCWGKSERGGMGSGLPDAVLRLPTIARLTSRAYAQQIAAGGENTCARMTDGTVTCTGENEQGQLGRGSAGPFVSSFGTVSSLTARIVQVAVARASVCALHHDGRVSCWGANEHGELGTGASDALAHPKAEPVVF